MKKFLNDNEDYLDKYYYKHIKKPFNIQRLLIRVFYTTSKERSDKIKQMYKKLTSSGISVRTTCNFLSKLFFISIYTVKKIIRGITAFLA